MNKNRKQKVVKGNPIIPNNQDLEYYGNLLTTELRFKACTYLSF